MKTYSHVHGRHTDKSIATASDEKEEKDANITDRRMVSA